MIVIKNKLKVIKKKYDDDDKNEYLETIKFSHLRNKQKDFNKIRLVDKQTQIPFTRNKETQTNKTLDKATDTRFELNRFDDDKEYKLFTDGKRCGKNDAKVQATTLPIVNKEVPPSPPSSSSSDSLGFRGKMKKGRRILRTTASVAQALGSGTMAGFRLAQGATELTFEGLLMLYDALQQGEAEAEAEAGEQDEEEDIVGQDAQQSLASSRDVDEINSSPPITVHSSSSSSNVEDVDINDAWMRQRSKSRSNTPDRGYKKK